MRLEDRRERLMDRRLSLEDAKEGGQGGQDSDDSGDSIIEDVIDVVREGEEKKGEDQVSVEDIESRIEDRRWK